MILRHHSKRFFFPELAVAQSRDGSGIPGIACQVVSAESFHRENPAGMKHLAARRMLPSLRPAIES